MNIFFIIKITNIAPDSFGHILDRQYLIIDHFSKYNDAMDKLNTLKTELNVFYILIKTDLMQILV